MYSVFGKRYSALDGNPAGRGIALSETMGPQPGGFDGPGGTWTPTIATAAAGKVPSRHDGLAITGFVLAFVLPLIGFILSLVSVVTAGREGRRASGLAVAGVVIGGLATAVVIIVIIAAAVAASHHGTTAPCDPTNVNWPYC